MSRILVVEDDPNILSLVTTLLRAESYEVVPVANGRDAIARLKREPFALVLSDIRMNPLDGLTLLKYVTQNHPQTSRLRCWKGA